MPKFKLEDLVRTFSKSDSRSYSYKLHRIKKVKHNTVPSYRINVLPERYKENIINFGRKQSSYGKTESNSKKNITEKMAKTENEIFEKYVKQCLHCYPMNTNGHGLHVDTT